ncbi:MAG: chorismate mutase [Emcibacteraceae bacterium]|nr:chorismate mutase [Emcibacteraceae bacterium]
MNVNELKNLIELKTEKCTSMPELRAEIDQLDRMVVNMLKVRQGYMEQAASIKHSREAVRDNDRVEDVVNKVSDHAKEVGVSSELVEELYRIMIEWSINYEFGKFDEIKSVDKTN